MSVATTERPAAEALKPVAAAIAKIAQDVPAVAAATGARSPNQAGLDRFVARCIADAPTKPDPVAFLKANVLKAEGFLTQLNRVTSGIGALPEHLEGVSAFDLSDAIALLGAAAIRAERKVA